MVGILVCALTGLLVSPVSWSHHWVWVAPVIIVLADLATRPLALSHARRWRLACWLGIGAIAAVFSGVLWTVPSSGSEPAVQGHVMTGWQEIVGDLYVLTGVIGLGIVAYVLVVNRRQDQPVVVTGSTHEGASTSPSTTS